MEVSWAGARVICPRRGVSIFHELEGASSR